MNDIELYGTTDANGDLDVTGERTVHGFLYRVEWMGANFDEGADISLTASDATSGTSCTLLAATSGMNTDTQYYPRAPACDTATDAEDHFVRIHFSGTLRLVVAGGGASKAGGRLISYENEGG